MTNAGSITDAEAVRKTQGSFGVPRGLATDLLREARGGDLGFSQERFASLLAELASKYLPASAGEREVVEFCRRLRLTELVLARACAEGNEQAWDRFLAAYRENIYCSALAITGAEEAACELADSIYADLYGVAVRNGERLSKLAYYDGRGSLEGWLRSVLAHEHLNRWRGGRRLVSLEEECEIGRQFPAPEDASETPPDPRLESAADEALAALSSEDRYLLASYYLDGQTLAEIGAALGVHESTISRRLERTNRSLTKQVVKNLRRKGMSRDQAREALETDVRDLAVDVRRHLRGARNETETVLSTGAKESP